MRPKVYRGNIYGADFTKREQKAMKIEISRQVAKFWEQHLADFDKLILYVLHTNLGFGKKRLRRFYDAFTREYETLMKHYEMPDSGVWLADRELKRIGADVDKWEEERKDEVVMPVDK